RGARTGGLTPRSSSPLTPRVELVETSRACRDQSSLSRRPSQTRVFRPRAGVLSPARGRFARASVSVPQRSPHIPERGIRPDPQLADAGGKHLRGLLRAALGSTALRRDERAVAPPRLDQAERLKLPVTAGNRVGGQAK